MDAHHGLATNLKDFRNAAISPPGNARARHPDSVWVVLVDEHGIEVCKRPSRHASSILVGDLVMVEDVAYEVLGRLWSLDGENGEITLTVEPA